MSHAPRLPEPSDGYSAEVDSVSVADWYRHVSGFRDASIYQLWQHAPDREGLQRVSRLLLRRRGQVVAAAELRLFTLPLTKLGIAYVRWGPLWRRPGEPDSLDVLRQALRALHHEYVVRRGMVLRLVPRLAVEDSPYFPSLTNDEGFSPLDSPGSQRTLLMRLSGDLEELRAGLAPTWRRHLKKAERAGLEVVSGSAPELFDDFVVVFNQMLERKRFAPGADIHKHRRIQAALPDDLKMGVLIARKDGQTCAGLIYSAIGDTAIYLFGATNDVALQTSAGYLLQWEAIKCLRARGVQEYDLNGINPALNPGLYQFKKGLAGPRGTEITFHGPLQALRPTLPNRVLLWLERELRKLRVPRSERQPATSRPALAAGANALGAGKP
jgi:hypothetical protein